MTLKCSFPSCSVVLTEDDALIAHVYSLLVKKGRPLVDDDLYNNLLCPHHGLRLELENPGLQLFPFSKVWTVFKSDPNFQEEQERVFIHNYRSTTPCSAQVH